MVTTKQLEDLAERIGDAFDAERVVLFGSHAHGPPREDSDVDLLVVAETGLPWHQRYGAVRRLVADVPAAFDIVVKTPEEYARLRSVVNTIVYYAEQTGKVLYER